MQYVYYDPASMQIMAEYDTPNLSVQVGWAEKGYTRALVAPGVQATRNHKVSATIQVDNEPCVTEVAESLNPEQEIPPSKTRLDELLDKLEADTITDVEIREMLRLEREGG